MLTLKDGMTAKWQAVTDKMKSSGMGLVKTFQGYWASITAGWFAVAGAAQKAFEMGENYAKFAQSMNAFQGLVQQLGLDATVEFEKIRKASGGLIDDKSLVEAANRAMSLGLPFEKIAGFLEIARAKAREMGTDTATAFNDLVVALGRQSAPILDNLGIIVKTEAANEAYARSLGKTVAQLTDAEKKQAFMNAALDAGAASLARQNLAVSSFSEDIARAKATLANIELWIGQLTLRLVIYFEGLLNAFKGYLLSLASGVVSIFAVAEEVARKLGQTNVTFFGDLKKHVSGMANEAILDARRLFGEVFIDAEKVRKELGGGLGAGAQAGEPAAAVQAEQTAKRVWVAIDGIREKTKKFVIEYEQTITASVAQTATLVRLTAKDMVTTFGEVYNAIWEANGGFQSAMLAGLDSIQYGIVDEIGGAWESMFGEANSLLEMFIKSFVEQLTSNVVKSAIGGLLSLFPGGGFLGGIFGGLFHGGGTVLQRAHSGAYIDAPPSREFPILVRGGETIRTEAQEREVQRATSQQRAVSITVNVQNLASKQAFKDVVQEGMRELGITDVAEYFKNNRSNLVLQA